MHALPPIPLFPALLGPMLTGNFYFRQKILRAVKGTHHLSYMFSMMDLFATCAQVPWSI